MAQIKLKQPQVIEPHHMVGVLMCVDDGMHNADLFADQLLIKIRRSVNQQVPFRQTKNRARSRPLVSRMIALACITATTNGRDTDRSAGPQQD